MNFDDPKFAAEVFSKDEQEKILLKKLDDEFPEYIFFSTLDDYSYFLTTTIDDFLNLLENTKKNLSPGNFKKQWRELKRKLLSSCSMAYVFKNYILFSVSDLNLDPKLGSQLSGFEGKFSYQCIEALRNSLDHGSPLLNQARLNYVVGLNKVFDVRLIDGDAISRIQKSGAKQIVKDAFIANKKTPNYEEILLKEFKKDVEEFTINIKKKFNNLYKEKMKTVKQLDEVHAWYRENGLVDVSEI